MVAVLRHTELANATGAVVAAGGALVNQGQDYATEVVVRTLAAVDIGSTAGKTQHASGMIFAEFQGATVKRVISAAIVRTANNFEMFFTGTDAVEAAIGFQITNANGGSTLRLLDSATGAGGRLAAGDRVIITVELGNS
jgi:hypothetical protein